VVSRPFDWNFTGPAWMGERDVGVRSARSPNYDWGPAPRGLNGIAPCKTNFKGEVSDESERGDDSIPAVLPSQ
jgi:hypothetical protein